MAGRYRALLIGNSHYPADEHNLQTLKGPVMDLVAVNRALVDDATGLFDDTDVTVLSEVTSTRALRALSGFFGSAHRDDVLLVYFSGHGKLDQHGRLHLCMQDTETTDLLSTAVSSSRLNEFVETSRARNVAFVLDCCHAGAFRGGDFGDAVAGPGRYVLASCRATQLANDATDDNGTSYFTQHLVDGLLGEAADRDRDGFVDFSDLYAYIDRQLRVEGKQIPQRRVEGDGELRLARRPAAGPLPEPPDGTVARTRERRLHRNRRRIATAAGAVVALVAVAVVTLVLTSHGTGNRATPGQGSYTAAGPWRIRIDGTDYGRGCSVTLQDSAGTQFDLPGDLFNVARYQVPKAGRFSWTTTDRHCLVTPLAGPGGTALPFTQTDNGDTDLFTPPARGISVSVLDSKGSHCTLRLYNSSGQELATAQWGPGDADPTLDPAGSLSVYLFDDNCVVRLSAPA